MILKKNWKSYCILSIVKNVNCMRANKKKINNIFNNRNYDRIIKLLLNSFIAQWNLLVAIIM